MLLGAGIPLLEGLLTLREKEAAAPVAQALDAVIAALHAGQSLSGALKSQPASFDALFVAVIQSSERTGQIEQALREHAAYLGWVVAVRGGERLSVALQRAGLTTPVSLRMIRVGERSGALGPMLRNAAEFYDEELSRLTELVTRLVNPVLMLVMGVVIGAIVVLMYLPIFQLVFQLVEQVQ